MPTLSAPSWGRSCRRRAGVFRSGRVFFLDISRTRSRALPPAGALEPFHRPKCVLRAPTGRPIPSGWCAATDRHRIRREPSRRPLLHHHQRRAPNFRLVSAPVSDPSKATWSRCFRIVPTIKVDGTDAFRDHLVVYEREAGLRQVRVLTLATGEEHLISFPEPVYTHPDSRESGVRHHAAPLHLYLDGDPSSVVDYDMAARTWTVRKQTEVLGGYDPSLYRSERLFATAPTEPRSRSRWSTGSRSSGTGGARSAEWLWRLWPELRPGVLLQQPESARPRVRGGDCACAGRRGDGAGLVRGGASCSTSETPSPTSSRRPSI